MPRQLYPLTSEEDMTWHPPSWGKGPEKTGPLWKTMGLNQSCENSTLLQRCQNKSFLNWNTAGFGVCFEDALQFWNYHILSARKSCKLPVVKFFNLLVLDFERKPLALYTIHMAWYTVNDQHSFWEMTAQSENLTVPTLSVAHPTRKPWLPAYQFQNLIYQSGWLSVRYVGSIEGLCNLEFTLWIVGLNWKYSGMQTREKSWLHLHRRSTTDILFCLSQVQETHGVSTSCLATCWWLTVNHKNIEISRTSSFVVKPNGE